MDQFDVVIVGARCAGSPLAVLLAREGLDVCVVDQAKFPSDTLSTHLIQSHGVAILDRLGLRDALLEVDAAEIDRISLINDDVRIDAEVQEDDLPALCIRRIALDEVLVAAADAAGADVRTRTRVTGLIREDGRVAGVETADGPIRAHLVVGADGMRSNVAEWVGSQEYHVAPGGRMFAVAYFEGVAGVSSSAEGRLRIGRVGDHAFIAAPTDHGLFMAGVGTSMSNRDAFTANRDEHFDRGLQAWPELADLVAGSTRVGPIRMITEWHSFFREAAGPGWALLGDAGHFKDFTPGQGISDALRQGDHLASAILAGLTGDLDAELRRWWSWRDDDAWDMYWFASDLGSPGASTPLETRLLRNVSKHPDGPRDLLKVFDHQISPSELFTTPRLIRAALRSLVDRPRLIGPSLREIVAAAKEERRRERVRPPSIEPARLPASVTAA